MKFTAKEKVAGGLGLVGAVLLWPITTVVGAWVAFYFRKDIAKFLAFEVAKKEAIKRKDDIKDTIRSFYNSLSSK